MRQALRRMRRDVHREMAVPALYLVREGATARPCTVRPHDLPSANGRPAGSDQGLAQQIDLKPRLVFIADDAPKPIRVGAIVSVEPGEAYRISFVHPPHGITTMADVTRLDAHEAADLPVP